MLRSAVARRISTAAVPRGHRILSSSFFSTDPAADQPQVRPAPSQPQPFLDREPEDASEARARAAAKASAAAADEAAEELRKMKRSRVKAAEYEDEQERVLRSALQHVLRLGWSESALIAGARDAGVSPAIVGAFPKKEAALIEFFMDDCLQRLIDRIDSGEELGDLILNERLAKLIRIRLEMQAPYISKWPQALSIQAQPMNLSTSFKQRAMLVDEFWHTAGEQGSDIDWYVKRTVLGGIYSTSEIFMLTDVSPDFRDTWSFVDRRVKDAFDLQKTVQEATYLAEAVGAGMSTSVQGFVKRLFQGGKY